jgi:hypothetical protein
MLLAEAARFYNTIEGINNEVSSCGRYIIIKVNASFPIILLTRCAYTFVYFVSRLTRALISKRFYKLFSFNTLFQLLSTITLANRELANLVFANSLFNLKNVAKINYFSEEYTGGVSKFGPDFTNPDNSREFGFC